MTAGRPRKCLWKDRLVLEGYANGYILRYKEDGEEEQTIVYETPEGDADGLATQCRLLNYIIECLGFGGAFQKHIDSV